MPASIRRPRRLACLLAGLGLGLAISSCGGKPAAPPPGTAVSEVTVTLNPYGCKPTPAVVGIGYVSFNIVDEGTTNTTEVELRTSNHEDLLGEHEGLIPGEHASFELPMTAGNYILYCPGAVQSSWPFTIPKPKRTP